MNEYLMADGQELHDYLHDLSDSIFMFLVGYLIFFNALSCYRQLLKADADKSYYLWYHLNKGWLFMNYEPIEMLLNELI
ncbi:hypothetical protein [Cyanothece sp. BG0011]|uniref:hypothetical protein n=1 Tax=Cyanothece sp. BG0011 TaxID=2082950 RepID=UPI000D1F0D86|nr:hypothetical protein [Cyanothece sp. BG0011]